MSERAETREIQEEIEFLNLALCNLQFVYEDGGSYFLSQPFEIKKQDKPIFSNLRESQQSKTNLVKFPQSLLSLENYERIEKVISSVSNISLSKYEEEAVQRKHLVNYIKGCLESADSKKPEGEDTRKRRRSGEQEFYTKFLKKIKKGKVMTAKDYYKSRKHDIHLPSEAKERIAKYYQLYNILKMELMSDIKSHIISSRNNMLFRRIFTEEIDREKLKIFYEDHKISTYLRRIKSFLAECQIKLAQEEETIKKTPLNYALRRLLAPPKDFDKSTLLPINRDIMLQDLNTDEPDHLRHTEQLVMHYSNDSFPQLEKEIQNFLRKNRLKDKIIHGAFYNLFSTRDMCERCAVCLTLDHAANNGFAAKLKQLLHSHNQESIPNPFVVYVVSSRKVYTTSYGTAAINSREYAKGIDSQSNSERGREVTELSDANISIQATFFSHNSKEYTPAELIRYKNALMDIGN